eukprot:760411-Hanusia_phi.AAC.1
MGGNCNIHVAGENSWEQLFVQCRRMGAGSDHGGSGSWKVCRGIGRGRGDEMNSRYPYLVEGMDKKKFEFWDLLDVMVNSQCAT